MNDAPTETSTFTLEDLAQAIHNCHLRVDFVTRVRANFETDASVLAWFSRENIEYHGQTPWEVFYDHPRAQGNYIDATCNIFVRRLYKRLPVDLPSLPPVPSEG